MILRTLSDRTTVGDVEVSIIDWRNTGFEEGVAGTGLCTFIFPDVLERKR